MRIIPVIDYFQGQVVLAKHGHRKRYQPVTSMLTKNTDPVSIIQSILSITEFNTIYIADLDSIERDQTNYAFWLEIFHQFSDTHFWLDIGQHVDKWTQLYAEMANVRPVIGSESITSVGTFQHTLKTINQYSPVLSMDFKNNVLLGPPSFIESCAEWPDDIILLNLDQVGSFSGPDFSSLEKVTPYLPAKCNIYLGGGVKDRKDLERARKYNFAGVLIASALHNRNISRDDLKEFTC